MDKQSQFDRGGPTPWILPPSDPRALNELVSLPASWELGRLAGEGVDVQRRLEFRSGGLRLDSNDGVKQKKMKGGELTRWQEENDKPRGGGVR